MKVTIKTDSFANADKWKQEGYTCISSVGKIYGYFSYIENDIDYIKGVKTTYGMSYQMKSLDTMATYISYKTYLDKIKDLDKSISELGDKVVLLCYYGKERSSYNNMLLDYLYNKYDCFNIDPNEIESHRATLYDDHYKLRGHFNLSDQEVGEILESYNYRVAKAKKNPHSYTMRKGKDHNQFLKVVKHIRCNGDIREFWGIQYRQFDFNNNSYWTMPQDLEDKDCDLINKAIIDESNC